MYQDEKTWIKTNAKRYASSQGISVEQALQALTEQANRQVQFGSPGEWDQSASAFLNQAGRGLLPADSNSGPGYMFYAIPDQKANMDMYAQFGHTNTPSGQDLTAAASRDQNIRQNVSNATLIAAGVAGTVAGAGPLSAGAMDAYAAYKAAAAGYSPGTALGTGMAASGGVHTLGATVNAGIDQVFGTGQPFGTGFSQRFSYPGLAAAMAVGGPTAMYSTAMFSWVGVPNALGNWLTLPGFIISANSTVFGNVAGQAAQGAVKSSTNQ